MSFRNSDFRPKDIFSEGSIERHYFGLRHWQRSGVRNVRVSKVASVVSNLRRTVVVTHGNSEGIKCSVDKNST